MLEANYFGKALINNISDVLLFIMFGRCVGQIHVPKALFFLVFALEGSLGLRFRREI